MSLIDMLAFGNQRHCQYTKHPIAIMTALGTTAWYKEYRQRTSGQDDEVIVANFVHESVLSSF
jgi:hypothetical protein